MQRAEGWKMRLEIFDYDIKFVNGSENNAPFLRRYEGTGDDFNDTKAPGRDSDDHERRSIRVTLRRRLLATDRNFSRRKLIFLRGKFERTVNGHRQRAVAMVEAPERN